MVGITNKKALAFAALAATASADWTDNNQCAGTPQPFLCDDGMGHETTSIITVYPSGCPGYTDWNTWPAETSTTSSWGTWETVNPSTTWNTWANPSTTWDTWASYSPEPTAWDYWYNSNGQPICHNGMYKDGSPCVENNGWFYGENGVEIIIITLTEVFTTPCETGWAEATTIWYTTDCGCTETPYPEHPAYTTYTTECPESWGLGATVTVTVPVATWTPPAQVNYGNGQWAAAQVSGKPVMPAYCGYDNKDMNGASCNYAEFIVEYEVYVKECEQQEVVVYFYGADMKPKPLAPAYCGEDNVDVYGAQCDCDQYKVYYQAYVVECQQANVVPYVWGYNQQGKPVPPPVCSAKGMGANGKPCDYAQYQVQYVAYQAQVAAVQSWAAYTIQTPAATSTGTWATWTSPAAVSTGTWSTWVSPAATSTGTWSTWASPAAASSTGTWSSWVSPAAATTPAAWAPIKGYTGAASSNTVSQVMVVLAGVVAGAALLL